MPRHILLPVILNYLTELRILDCYGCSYTSISHSYRVVERLRQDRWKICRKHRVLQVSLIIVYLGHKLSFIKKNETSPLTRGGLTNHIINNTKTNNQ